MVLHQDLVLLLYDGLQSKLISSMFEKEAETLIFSNYPLLDKEIVLKFLISFKKIWNHSKVARRKDRLFATKSDWLNVEISPNFTPSTVPGPCGDLGGRPPVSFDDGSVRTKKRKIEAIRIRSTSELLYAAMMSLREDKRYKDAKVIEEMMKRKEDASPDMTYSNEEALALILDCKLSKADYQTIRSSALDKNCRIYPSYNDVRSAKETCIPTIHTTDYTAKVALQDLLDHTSKRIINLTHNAIPTNSNLRLISKVGFDGSTGQSVYKQITSEDTAHLDLAVEESLFLTCIVPLKLVNEDTKEAIWTNPKPSSTHFCRPLRFQYTKEDQVVLKEEYACLNQETSQLRPTFLKDEIGITHTIETTMLDGKVQGVLSDKTNSMQCCSICGCSPSNMNKLDDVIKTSSYLTPSSFVLGLSILHMWIRCMECFLNIAYRMDFKSWQARGADKKAQVKSRKEQIQRELRTKLGLVVDMPRPGGSGTSNDGNTGRRFFKNPSIVANILNVEEILIKRVHIILCTISSFRMIDPDKLQQYCLETAKLYVHHYPWYPMPQAFHKLLIHSHQIVRYKEMPIGMLSEEAQEASNKKFKNFREFFTRKISRKKTNEDLLRRLLCASDPLISSMRRSLQREKQKEEIPLDCNSLFLE